MLLTWSLLVACSDYGFDFRREAAAPPEYDGEAGRDLDPKEPDACVVGTPYPGIPVGTDETCQIDPIFGTLDATVEWGVESFYQFAEFSEVLMTPVVGHLSDEDGDGVFGSAGDIPDIALVSDLHDAGHPHGVLRVLRGDGAQQNWYWTGETLEDKTQVYPYQYSGLALGDVDSDGRPDIVMIASIHGAPGSDDPGGGSDSEPPLPGGDTGGPDPDPDDGENQVRDTQLQNCGVAVMSHDGDLKWYTSELLFGCGGHAPAIADLDADGKPEVLVGPYILDGLTGALEGQGGAFGAYSAYAEMGYMSFAADLDADGIQEVVAGRSLLDHHGNEICTIDAAYDDGFPAVADLDGDGLGEFLVVGNGRVRLFEHDCSFKTEWPLAGGGNGGPPTIGDFDGDALPEIGIAGATVYSVYEPDGTLLWSQSVTDTSSHATGSSVFDFDGDGQAEVVYADEVSLWVYDGATGTVRLQDALHTSRTLHEYPVIADVDADGHAEIIIPNGGGHHGSQHGGLYVLGSADDSWRPNREVWNQHAYSITNINDDLSIPSPAVANWPTWNSFRSGDIDPISGRLMVDARPVLSDTCARECRQGILGIAYQVGNHGLADMRAEVPVTVYAVDGEQRHRLETVWTEHTTPTGWSSDGFVLRIDLADLPDRAIEIVVDDDGTGGGVVTECHEDNNARVYDLSSVCERYED